MKRIAIGLLCLGAVACNGAESEIKEAVRAGLRDPQSAIFGEIRVSSNGNWACVTVNSKNGLGGYEGNRQAVARRNTQSGAWTLSSVMADYSDQDMCLSAIATYQNFVMDSPPAVNSTTQ